MAYKIKVYFKNSISIHYGTAQRNHWYS